MLLRYPYEVRDASEYFDDIQDVKITKDMLDLAKHIVAQKSGHFEPEKFEDHYKAALGELLTKKQQGLPIGTAKKPAPSKPDGRAAGQPRPVWPPSGKPAPARPAKAPAKKQPSRSARPADVRRRDYEPCIPTHGRTVPAGFVQPQPA